MTQAVFFRLLREQDKATALRRGVASLAGTLPADVTVYDVALDTFTAIPGSPFAYWVSQGLRAKFDQLPSFNSEGRAAKQGLATADDFRFVRCWWEVRPSEIFDPARRQERQYDQKFQQWCIQQTDDDKKWLPFAKGGEFSQYYSDIHLLVNWAKNGKEIKSLMGPDGRIASRPQNSDYYFLPGLTWSDRTTRLFSSRVWPAGGIFSVKGSAGFSHNQTLLPGILGFTNSLLFNMFLSLLVGAGDAAARSYQVGTIGHVPTAPLVTISELGKYALDCWSLKRHVDETNETSRVFSLPALVTHRAQELGSSVLAWQEKVADVASSLEATQREINERVFRLYGVTSAEQALIEESLLGKPHSDPNNGEKCQGPATRESGEPIEESAAETLSAPRPLVADILSYALGCALGRWDVRMALDRSLSPRLSGPFDPLPVCSPGTLVRSNGLPAGANAISGKEWLRARPDAISLPPEGFVQPTTILDTDYPLTIAWEGLLTDDPEHQQDVVTRVRATLELLWGEHAEAIEQEACEMLGVKSLREYFAGPRGFFEEHVTRYSKSRRKAPIYWLLQSNKRSFGLWLYYHRLDADLLFKALTNYVDPKIQREEGRLSDMRSEKSQAGATGSAARQAERAIERQDALIAELRDFRDKLNRAASLGLKPDLDDGVMLNAAPLWELMPWRVAKEYWQELLKGEYGWSSIGKQLRDKKLVPTL